MSSNVLTPRWLRVAAGLAVLAVVGLLWLAVDLAAVPGWLAGQGPWAPLAFVVLFVVLTPALVPDTPLAALAGVAFGVFWGTVLTTLAAFLAAALEYLAARYLVRDLVIEMLGRNRYWRALEVLAERSGTGRLLLLRLVPINPALVGYALGVAGVRPFPYLVACLGLVPAYFATAYVGDWMSRAARPPGDFGLVDGMNALVFVVALIIIGLALRNGRRLLAAPPGEATSAE